MLLQVSISANTYVQNAHWKRLQRRMGFLHFVNILGASLGFNNCKHVFTCCTLKQRMCMPDRLEHNCILHIVKFSKKQNKTKEFWWSSSYESYQCVLTDVFCFEVQTCKYHTYHKMQPKLLDSGDYMKACNMCYQHFLFCRRMNIFSHIFIWFRLVFSFLLRTNFLLWDFETPLLQLQF